MVSGLPDCLLDWVCPPVVMPKGISTLCNQGSLRRSFVGGFTDLYALYVVSASQVNKLSQRVTGWKIVVYLPSVC